ncbi:MAG: hypothetical protein JW940_00520 [Polyangiaceae bacterium]|nr:hypothetical protein [Polyangiaceae bacterium]
MAEPLASWPAFAEAVHARLERGRQVYGDQSFNAEPGALLDEIAEELQDTCAWSFILWARLESLRSRLQVLEQTPAGRPLEGSPTAPMGRMVGASGRSGGPDR